MNQNQKLRSLTNERTKYKTDRFTLLQEDPNRWKVSGRDSNGSYRRIRFEARNLSEAIKAAEEILSKASSNELAKSNPHDFPLVQISDALIRAAATRDWTHHTRREDNRCCEYFLEWVDAQGLEFWHDLRFEHVQKYYKELLDRKLAYDTIRLYLIPVRRTAMWMASNWSRHYINICQNLRLSRRKTRSSAYDDEEGNPFLTLHQVLSFLDYLARQEKMDDLLIGVSLQGLAGLQMQEALRLTWDKVDLSEETVTIDGLVKNRYRIRKIPIPSVVTWILRQIRQISPPSGSLIQEYASYDNYSHAVARELKRWNAEVTITPKDLRNTLQTEAIENGWYGYYVQRYVGHAPTTIGERHYHGDKGCRMLSLYREKVIPFIEQKIRSWEAPVDSRILLGPWLAVNS